MLIVLLIGPRILRTAYASANLADEAIFYLPYLAATGETPYVDFQCPYNPGSVWLLAASYAIFGVSYRVAEFLTAILVTCIAGLLYTCGRRAFGVFGAVASAATFAWHPLVFGYHVFAVEFCTTLCVWVSIFLLLKYQRPSLPLLLSIALLMTAACLFKKSACGPALGVALSLWWVRRDRRAAVRYTVMLSCLVGGATLILLACFGMPYLQQTLVFHLAKGEACPLWARPILLVRKCCDPLSLLGLVGLALFTIQRRKSPTASLVAVLFGSEVFFNLLLSSTYWTHTHIPMSAYLAFFAGLLVHEMKALRGRLSARSGGTSWKLFRAPALAVAIAIFLVVVTGGNVWRAAQVCHLPWGFGGMQRTAIRTLAARVAQRSHPKGRIFAPGFVALEARRRKTVDNIENAGVMNWIERTMEEEGLQAVLEKSRGKSFWDMIRLCRPYWVERVEHELAARELQAVVLPDAWSIEYPDPFPNAEGYRQDFKTKNYLVLIPKPGPSTETSSPTPRDMGADAFSRK